MKVWEVQIYSTVSCAIHRVGLYEHEDLAIKEVNEQLAKISPSVFINIVARDVIGDRPRG